MVDKNRSSQLSRIWLFSGTMAFILLVLFRSSYLKSLWLDETITYWVIKDGLGDAWHRSISYQGQSPLYFLCAWLVSKVLGTSEWGLRLPSLLLGITTLRLMFLLARRWLPEEGSWLSIPLLLSINEIQGAVFSARPYSLALVTSLLSIYALLRWQESRNNRWRYVYLSSSILMFYAHYLFAAAFVMHAIILITSRTEREWVWGEWGPAMTIGFIFCAPGFYQILNFSASATFMNTDSMPTLEFIVSEIAPYRLAVCTICGWLCAAPISGLPPASYVHALARNAALWILWLLVPPLMFAAHAYLTDTCLYLKRYFLWQTPAIALLLASPSGILLSKPSRMIFFSISLLLAIKLELNKIWIYDDFRSAIQVLNNQPEIDRYIFLFNPGLIELQEPDWVKTRVNPKEASEYAASALSYYVPRIPPILFPPASGLLNKEAESNPETAKIIHSESKIMLLSSKNPVRVGSNLRSAHTILIERFSGYGFTAESLGEFGNIGLWRLTRTSRYPE